jgi:hypothetical protein
MDSADVNACGHTLLEREDTCRIGMSTLAYEQSIQTNIIDEFRVATEVAYDPAKISAVDQTVKAKYSALAECTAGYATRVKQEIMPNIRRIVDALDLTLVSSEGDFIHQFVDCIMMGANTKAILAPADIEGVLENFMYSRHVNGTSRDFELPCHGSFVASGESGTAGEPFLQKTCGSDTRIAVMAYATREILDKDNGGLYALVAQLITDKIVSITAALTNVRDYGCLDRATGLIWYDSGAEPPVSGRELKSTLLRDTLATAQTPIITLTAMQWRNVNIKDLRNDDFIRLGNIVYRQSLTASWTHCCAIPGKCTPGESNFESNLPEIDTTVSIATIMTALTESMKDMQIDTITTRTVRFFLSVSGYASHSLWCPSPSLALPSLMYLESGGVCGLVSKLLVQCAENRMLRWPATPFQVIHNFEATYFFQRPVSLSQLSVNGVKEPGHVGQQHAVDPRVLIKRHHCGRAYTARIDLGMLMLCSVMPLSNQYHVFVAYQFQHGRHVSATHAAHVDIRLYI